MQPSCRRNLLGASTFAIAAVVLLAIAGCAQSSSAGTGALPGVVRMTPAGGIMSPIQHVVLMVQENHSFDDFFATYPGADGATFGLMKTPSGDVQVPLKEARLISHSLDHQHQSFELEYDHGKMDGFNLVKMALKKGVKVPAGTYPYRYVNPKQIAPYWEIAQNYVLGDHMFMTQSSSSFTGHQDLIAAGTPVGNGRNVIDFPIPSSWGCNAPPGTVTSVITPRGQELRGKGPFPCFTYATLRDLLDAKGVSWLYYTNTSRAAVWDAFDAIAAVRHGTEWKTNIIIPETQIYNDITYGTLPAVSWVIPDTLDSDHPGAHSDTGPSWIASVVNAVGQSQYWDSTVVIVVWDDWGGQFDHVPPPQLDGQGLGPRVPFLLVSAYARETSPSQPGYISHTQYEFGSIVKFIEDNWHLGNLGNTDVRANSILDCFDFTQKPRPFVSIQAKYSKEYFERRPPSGLPLDDQ